MERINLQNSNLTSDLMNKSAVARAVEVLAAGGLVIFPTETTYGAGVDATNPEAVQRLLRYKARREGKPLSIAVADVAMAEKYVELNAQARTLYSQFLPGPVTVISAGKGKVAEGVQSEFGTLGIRIPDHQLVRDIVFQLRRPITATSANPSDGARPYNLDSLFKTLSTAQSGLIDLALDAGELVHNPPSTIIDTTLSTPITLRQGALSAPSPTVTANPNARTIQVGQTRFQSASPEETVAVAGRLLLKHWSDIRNEGLIIALDGPLGAGKTVFSQGVAKFLGITDQLTSPTYTYIEEYPYTRHQTSGMLYHFDMWKVDTEKLFSRLEFDAVLKPKNIVVVEWFSQVKPFVETVLAERPDMKQTILPITIE